MRVFLFDRKHLYERLRAAQVISARSTHAVTHMCVEPIAHVRRL